MKQSVLMDISLPVMYSPMKRYPPELLEPFLEWYYDAKMNR